MKINSKIVILFALLSLLAGGLATFLNHSKIAFNLILLSFIFLSLATAVYLWETRKQNEK